MTGYASFADFAERLSKLSAKGDGTAVFYSTTTDNEEAAQSCTEHYPGKYYTWRNTPASTCRHANRLKTPLWSLSCGYMKS